MSVASNEISAAARDVYEHLIEAWNSRDAGAFAALFAPDGESIGFDGSQARGGEIRDHLEGVFGDHETAAYVAKVLGVRELGPDRALLRAMVGMVRPGRSEMNPATNALQSLVLERRDGSWRIVLLQNTPAQYHGRPELVEQHTAAIEQVRAAGATVA